MSGPWIAVVVVLCAIVAVLAVFTIGLAHRILPVLERITDGSLTGVPHDHVADAVGLAPSTPAPNLPTFYRTAPRSDGVSQGNRLILFLEGGCEPCAVLVADLQRKGLRSSDDVELVAVVDSLTFADRLPDRWSVILDEAHEVSREWQVRGTPAAVLIEPDGTFLKSSVPNRRKDIADLLAQSQPYASVLGAEHRSAL